MSIHTLSLGAALETRVAWPPQQLTHRHDLSGSTERHLNAALTAPHLELLYTVVVGLELDLCLLPQIRKFQQ